MKLNQKTKTVLIGVASSVSVAGFVLSLQSDFNVAAETYHPTFQLRYAESYIDDLTSSDNPYAYQVGYRDNENKPRIVVKQFENVQENVVDGAKGSFKYINNYQIRVTRAPYQTYDVNDNGKKAITIGHDDFLRNFKKAQDKALDIKWIDTELDGVNYSSSPQVPAIEFVYNHQLYKMEMPEDSNGASAMVEDVSPSYTKPTVTFQSNGNEKMVIKRAPAMSYNQPTETGEVTDK